MFDFSSYNNELTEVMRSIIQNKGLIDTGALLNSIEVVIQQDFSVEIIGEDYLSYLDKDNEIFDEFQILSKEILERAFKEKIEWQLQLTLAQSAGTT